MAKTKLHEVLAVEPNVKAKSDAMIKEGINTFKGKQGHFEGQIREYTPKMDDGDMFPNESSPLVTTVMDKINYVFKSWIARVDVVATKEETNRGATTIITIGGKDFEVGATTLLALEKDLKDIRTLLNSVLTLDPNFEWEYDADNMRYKTFPVRTFKQKKVEVPLIIVAATKEHPAQAKTVVTDEIIGEWTTEHTSGRIPASEKADILERLDEMDKVVKKGRQRANMAEVKYMEIGRTIQDFVLGT